MNIIQTNFTYTQPLISLDLNKVLFIPLHHPDAMQATPEQIHQWHKEAGYNGFGYNEYIRKDGTVYIGRGDHIGAQCANNNSKTYGICCEGNYDIEKEMPEAQFVSLIERIKYNQSRFPNFVAVKPHSYFNNTSCPGRYFPLERVYAALQPKPAITDLASAIKLLQENEIVNSPDYWTLNAVPGKKVEGEYTATLMVRMANKLLK